MALFQDRWRVGVRFRKGAELMASSTRGVVTFDLAASFLCNMAHVASRSGRVRSEDFPTGGRRLASLHEYADFVFFKREFMHPRQKLQVCSGRRFPIDEKLGGVAFRHHLDYATFKHGLINRPEDLERKRGH
jgi:hypothetical protein